MNLSEGISTHEISEIRREIELIKQIITETEPKLRRSDASMQQQIRLLTTISGLSRKILGTENISEGVEKDIRALEMLAAELMHLYTLYLSTMAAMGPLGLALIAIGALGSAINISHRTRG